MPKQGDIKEGEESGFQWENGRCREFLYYKVWVYGPSRKSGRLTWQEDFEKREIIKPLTVWCNACKQCKAVFWKPPYLIGGKPYTLPSKQNPLICEQCYNANKKRKKTKKT